MSATTLDLVVRVFGRVQGENLLVADGMGGHAAGEQAVGWRSAIWYEGYSIACIGSFVEMMGTKMTSFPICRR
ncbi:hypothetical protein N9B38_03200 [bacterium]|nr:hypothetical protein [bacterium]